MNFEMVSRTDYNSFPCRVAAFLNCVKEQSDNLHEFIINIDDANVSDLSVLNAGSRVEITDGTENYRRIRLCTTPSLTEILP